MSIYQYLFVFVATVTAFALFISNLNTIKQFCINFFRFIRSVFFFIQGYRNAIIYSIGLRWNNLGGKYKQGMSLVFDCKSKVIIRRVCLCFDNNNCVVLKNKSDSKYVIECDPYKENYFCFVPEYPIQLYAVAPQFFQYVTLKYQFSLMGGNTFYDVTITLKRDSLVKYDNRDNNDCYFANYSRNGGVSSEELISMMIANNELENKECKHK